MLQVQAGDRGPHGPHGAWPAWVAGAQCRCVIVRVCNLMCVARGFREWGSQRAHPSCLEATPEPLETCRVSLTYPSPTPPSTQAGIMVGIMRPQAKGADEGRR